MDNSDSAIPSRPSSLISILALIASVFAAGLGVIVFISNERIDAKLRQSPEMPTGNIAPASVAGQSDIDARLKKIEEELNALKSLAAQQAATNETQAEFNKKTQEALAETGKVYQKIFKTITGPTTPTGEPAPEEENLK